MDLPLGPAVDPTPRPLPPRVSHRGRAVTLEPLSVAHTGELWAAMQGAEDSWTYLPYGSFPTELALRQFLGGFTAQLDPFSWAVRMHATGRVEGWISLMEVRPANAEIELGHVWCGPALAGTRAATESRYLLMREAFALGYRRLVWKCHALNAGSRRAAERLGFVYEGTFRQHRIDRGRSRDTSWFSLLDSEWPRAGAALVRWLDESNFDARGRALRTLAELRAE